MTINLDAYEDLLNPAREIQRQMEEWSAVGRAQKLAEQAADMARVVDFVQPQRDVIASAVAHEDELLRHARDALMSYEHTRWSDLIESTTLASVQAQQDLLAGNLAEEAARAGMFRALQPELTHLADAQRYLCDVSPGISSVLADYENNRAQAESILAATQPANYAAMIGAIGDHLAQAAAVAAALNPLQQVVSSLSQAFGSAADIQFIQEQLSANLAVDFDQSWKHHFQSFEVLTAAAMFYADDEDVDGESDSEIDLDDHDEVDVNRLAIAFAVPAFELQIRLMSLAGRIDPVAVESGASWDRLILLIAAEFREHAVDLVSLAVPLLNQLNWPKMRQGGIANGKAETLSMEDAEHFGWLASRVLQLLAAIEQRLA